MKSSGIRGKALAKKGKGYVYPRREEKRKYYLKNKKRILETCSTYRKRNPDVPKTPKRRYGHLIAEARRRNVFFGISFKFFKKNLKRRCYYCGGLPTISHGSYMDRVDSNKGYVKKI